MPCLNEAETVGSCVEKALETLRTTRCSRRGGRRRQRLDGRFARDRRATAPASSGKKAQGYGSALMRGAEEARAPFIIMADADEVLRPDDLPRFIDGLRAGNDLVMGSRGAAGSFPAPCPGITAGSAIPCSRES